MSPGRALAAALLLGALTTVSCSAGADAPQNPLAGAALWVDPSSTAAQAQQQLRAEGRSADADALTPITSQPVATWLTTDDPAATVRRVTQQAEVTGQLPVFVLYHRPGRDCGSYSAGGSTEVSAYQDWVGTVADALGDQRAALVLEPDAIPQALGGQCALDGQPAATYAMLAAATQALAARPHATVFLDAGHPGWIADTDALASALRSSGIEAAAGFSLNVSNFVDTAQNQTYGDALSAAVGDKPYVVDVSRNGRGAPAADPNSVDAWCNPPGAGLGQDPQVASKRSRVAAYLWIKEPGASDGSCRPGEPPAGQFWPEYALRLIQQRP